MKNGTKVVMPMQFGKIKMTESIVLNGLLKDSALLKLVNDCFSNELSLLQDTCS